MRGTAIQHEPRVRDPLLRAIAELRDHIDRLIEEQKAVVDDYFASHVEEAVTAPERPTSHNGGGAVLAPAALTLPTVASATATAPVAPAAPRPKKPGSGVFERVDAPSATPPRPVAAAAAEPAAAGRPEDARERLDALARHLDRRLRQANGSAPEPSGRESE